MDLWSRGLGRRELVMDFTHYAVRRAGDGGIEILGVTEEPVAWEFRVHIAPDDIPGMVNIAVARPVIAMFARKPGTALAALWRRRNYEVQPGLEERVGAAHAHVMNRARPARAVRSQPDAGADASGSRAEGVGGSLEPGLGPDASPGSDGATAPATAADGAGTGRERRRRASAGGAKERVAI